MANTFKEWIVSKSNVSLCNFSINLKLFQKNIVFKATNHHKCSRRGLTITCSSVRDRGDTCVRLRNGTKEITEGEKYSSFEKR